MFHIAMTHDGSVQQSEDLLAYARRLAVELQDDMVWERPEGGYGGFWTAKDGGAMARIVARAAAALEFFRQHAGAESYWTHRAIEVYDSQGHGKSRETGVRALGDLLTEWIKQVEAGVIEVAGSRERAEFAVVTTDVMEQVRRLMEDNGTHPAAAIVLCGAALEIALRAVVAARGLTLDERPSIGALARLLRREQLITAQDVKDIEQCAGLRNSAAHGQFQDLSRERAGLLEQQTNILLRRLADLQDDVASQAQT